MAKGCVDLVESLRMVLECVRRRVEYINDVVVLVGKLAPNVGGYLRERVGENVEAIMGWLRIADAVVDTLVDRCMRRFQESGSSRYAERFVEEARRSGVVLAELDGCRAVLYRNRILFDGCWGADTSVYTLSITIEQLNILRSGLEEVDEDRLVMAVERLVESGRLPKKLLTMMRNRTARKLILRLLSTPQTHT